MIRRPPRSTLFPTRRSSDLEVHHDVGQRNHEDRRLHLRVVAGGDRLDQQAPQPRPREDLFGDRKSTRLNSSHSQISYAVFCLKKKKKKRTSTKIKQKQ